MVKNNIKKKIKILLLGSNGQLGSTFNEVFKSKKDIILYSYTKNKLDILNKTKLEKKIKLIRPDFIINCAAFTNVPLAEKKKTLCDLINETAVNRLGNLTYKYKSFLIHFSTDFVFNGKKKLPYAEKDRPNPINHYGISKLNGELKLKLTKCNFIIFRVSWVFSDKGKNFLLKICDLLRNQKIIKVTKTEIGFPTSCKSIANSLYFSINKLKFFNREIFHLSGNDYVSRFDYVKYILKYYGKKKKLKCKKIIPIKKILHDNIKRPKNSCLDSLKFSKSFNINLPNWRREVRYYLNRL